MALTKRIKELMTFTLPPDWHESRQLHDHIQKTALEELTASLTEEAYDAIIPFLQESAEQAERDRDLAPDQFGAGAIWSTPDNLAVINVFADAVVYSTREVEQTDALFASKGPLATSQVTGAGLAIFSMCYSDRGRFSESAIEDEKAQPATVCADPALLEAFYEMKAALANAGGDQTEDFRVLSASATALKGKPAACVDTEHYSFGVVERQEGYHLLLNRERQGTDWIVEEVHILLRCTPANFQYVSRDFQFFVDSLRWLDHN